MTDNSEPERRWVEDYIGDVVRGICTGTRDLHAIPSFLLRSYEMKGRAESGLELAAEVITVGAELTAHIALGTWWIPVATNVIDLLGRGLVHSLEEYVGKKIDYLVGDTPD